MFDATNTDLEYQVDRLDDQLSDPDSTLPVELKAAVQAILTEEDEHGRTIDARVERIRGDDAHVEFALRHVAREADRLHPGPDEDLEQREKKVCTCDDRYCKLKDGELPRTVREASSLSAGVREFNQTHAGRPIVLFEARDKYYNERGELKAIIRRCRIALRNRTHPEKLEEWGELTAADFTDDGRLKNGATGAD